MITVDIKQKSTDNTKPLTRPLLPATPQKKRKLNRKTVIISSTVIALLIIGIVTWLIALSTSEEDAMESPEYATILPQGKTTESLGGWTRVSPPNNEPVYAYSDTIDNTSISVSQQTLPEKFKQNTDTNVADLAKSYNATKKLNADKTIFYQGTSSKGPQSVIFTKADLLILIKSEKIVADTSWSAYINSLTSSSTKNMPRF